MSCFELTPAGIRPEGIRLRLRGRPRARRRKVAKAAISVAAGAKDRRKLVDIQDPSAALAAARAAWLATLELEDGA